MNDKWNDGPYLILKENSVTSMTICWTTSKRKNSSLFWGNSKSTVKKEEVSTGKKHHSVTIGSLKPDTNYFYIIKENLTLFPEGNIFSFRTLKEKEINEDYKFIIAGDLQPRNKHTLKTNKIIAKQIHKEKPDFIIQTGDLVQIGSIKKYWHNLMMSLPLMASSRAILPVVGNHEYYLFHKNKNFKSYFPYSFPGKKSSYYSKDIGDIHLTFLDPYDGGFAGMSSKISKEQKKWFVKDLEKAVSHGTGWIFVILHQAVLSNGEYSGDLKLQKWILPIVSKYSVDAVFWGHAHLYEHWKYHYGKNGYVINKVDTPGKNPIDFFCIGSSGARLENNFKLFTHKNFNYKNSKWFNIENGKIENKATVQYPWNREVYFEGKSGIDKFEETDKHYYHLPFDGNGKYTNNPEVSFNTENKWFGYRYGENTLHYAKVRVTNDMCTISIYYADGSLLRGHDGSLPQEFILKKKNRKID